MYGPYDFGFPDYSESLKMSNSSKDAIRNRKEEWLIKYDNLQYITKGDKVTVVLNGKEDNFTVESEKCSKCEDGKVIIDGGWWGNKDWAPCSCPLGNKWTKDTEFMGPKTVQGVYTPYVTKVKTKPKVIPIDSNENSNYNDITKSLLKVTNWKTEVNITSPTLPAVTVIEQPTGRKFKKSI